MKYLILLILLCDAAFAESMAEKHAEGRGSLPNLLQNKSVVHFSYDPLNDPIQHAPFYLLSPPYNGRLWLVYHSGIREKSALKERDLHFNAYTRTTKYFDECDRPFPRLPMIFFVRDPSPSELPFVNRDYYFQEDFAFLAANLPNVKSLSLCKTLKELISKVPGIVDGTDEEATHPSLWYNWFLLNDTGRIDVVFLFVDGDNDGKITRMDIWRGMAIPQ